MFQFKASLCPLKTVWPWTCYSTFFCLNLATWSFLRIQWDNSYKALGIMSGTSKVLTNGCFFLFVFLIFSLVIYYQGYSTWQNMNVSFFICIELSGSWWWTGRPGVLWFMGSQRVGHDWGLNWTELFTNSLALILNKSNHWLLIHINSLWADKDLTSDIDPEHEVNLFI